VHCLLRTRSLVFVAMLVSALVLPAATMAAFPGANGKIAFQSDRDGNREIYSMNRDGTSPTNLTNHSDADFDPAFSPDGLKIAFTSSRAGGGFEIFTMNVDGTGVTQLTNATDQDRNPAWSPDGQRLVFQSARDGNFEIYSMNADGTAQTRLTSNPARDENPAWSPDGTKIAFESDRTDPSYDIYTMTPSGSSVTPIAPQSGEDRQPNWSPDGSKLAFQSNRGGQLEVWTMNANGTSQQPLGGNGTDPAWSPDGAMITYTEHFGVDEIYTMAADGSGKVNRTSNAAIDERPDWQPLYTIPKSASWIDAALVPVFRQCGTGANPANTTHGAPDIPGGTNPDSSCTPAVRTSSISAVGIQAQGSATLTVVPGNLATPADEADDTIDVTFTDIRAGSATGSDYDPNPSGADMTLTARVRITDLLNGTSETSPGTVTDLDLAAPVDCAGTASPAVGATCTANTSADAVIPGIVKEGKSAVVQIFRLRLIDSGPDGVRGNSDDRLFATQGLFNP
jgi:Tol biopolymer transport system component